MKLSRMTLTRLQNDAYWNGMESLIKFSPAEWHSSECHSVECHSALIHDGPIE